MSKLIKAFENLKDSLNIKNLDYLIIGERQGRKGKTVSKKMKVSEFLNKVKKDLIDNREQLFPTFPYLVDFTKEYVYYSDTTPTTGNITVTQTEAVLGIVQKLYHNDAYAPTLSGVSDIQIMGTGAYVPGAINIIYLEWTEANRVEYWITQEGAQVTCSCIDDYRSWDPNPFLNYCNGIDTITPINGAFVNGNGFYEFDGINDYLDNGSKVEPTIFTFNTWVNFDTINIDNRIMSYRFDGNNYLLIRVTTGNILELRYKNSTPGSTGSFVSTITFAAGTWYNIAVGIDGNATVNMWVNGAPIAVTAALVGTRVSIAQPHTIGGDASSTMDGQMGNFKKSGCMLTDTEVLNNFNTQKTIYGL